MSTPVSAPELAQKKELDHLIDLLAARKGSDLLSLKEEDDLPPALAHALEENGFIASISTPAVEQALRAKNPLETDTIKTYLEDLLATKLPEAPVVDPATATLPSAEVSLPPLTPEQLGILTQQLELLAKIPQAIPPTTAQIIEDSLVKELMKLELQIDSDKPASQEELKTAMTSPNFFSKKNIKALVAAINK